MKTLYEFTKRRVGYATILGVINHRGDISVKSSEKVIPPILEYTSDGKYREVLLEEVLSTVKFHPYKANSDKFTKERLSDLEVASFYKHLEYFPTLPTDQEVNEEGKSNPVPNAIAEFIFSQMVYLKPDPELTEKLEKLDFIEKGKLQASILEIVDRNFTKATGKTLDLFSVPKKKVGAFCYVGDKNHVSPMAKKFSFGFYNCIPCDRILRELSSIKNCLKFSNPPTSEYSKDIIPKEFQGYVQMVKVAVVGTEFSMMDGCDLFPSAKDKLACKIKRRNLISDLSTVKKEDRNFVAVPFAAGIQLYQEENICIDEEVDNLGPMRLVMPGGVKMCGQPVNFQCYNSKKEEIDLMMNFSTIAAKGAICLFCFSGDNHKKKLTLEQAKEIFENLEKTTFEINGRKYEGYEIEVPVFRSNHLYTNLCKSVRGVTVDLVTNAILKEKYTVDPKVEQEYQKLKELHKGIQKSLNQNK